MTTKRNITIDIVSDAICPWCFVGKRRVERAMERTKDKYEFEVRWRPFYLDPTLPTESVDKYARYEEKFGVERTKMMLKQMVQLGKTEGIEFDFGGKVGNTRDYHRLVEHAYNTTNAEVANQLVEELFKCYFERKLDVTDRAVLVQAAKQVGMDENQVKTFLDSENGSEDVDREIKMFARQYRVSGVPHFVIGDAEGPKHSVSGAQNTDVFEGLFADME